MQLALIDSIAIDFTNDTDQRYTPQEELLKVRNALGGTIGLDPCSNPLKTVSALAHITEADNCFLTDWEPLLKSCRTVFMNPPYSDSAPFISELCSYLECDSIDAAVTLTLAGLLFNKKTQGFVRKYAKAVCCPYGRINFIGGGGSNDRDVAYILWGDRADVELFRSSMTGLVMML